MAEIKDGNAMLDQFYKDWSLTIEGLSTEHLDSYEKVLKDLAGLKDGFAFYKVTGKAMNEKYGLTGDNAYKDDLTIVVVLLEDLVEPMKIVIPRFDWGGRWFTDIVDNNARRQNEIDGVEENDEED